MKRLLAILVIAVAILSFQTEVYAQSNNTGSATLMVYRDGFIYGAWKDFDVKVDGKKMGELAKNKSMHTYQLTPGKHTVAPGDDDKSVGINMSSGTTYIVEYKVRFGILGAIPKLDIKNVEQGKKDSKLVRHAMMKDGIMGDDQM